MLPRMLDRRLATRILLTLVVFFSTGLFSADSLEIEAAAPAAAPQASAVTDRFSLPATDAGVPGAGPPLAEAHGIGLIHRDVKPENIILCERGGIPDVAKVVDFGLVRDLERTSDASRTGVVTGTPLYLAPEAIKAPDRIDGRADLYALGAVGYFMLTGTHVFTGATLVEVCSHHLHTAPVAPSERLARAAARGRRGAGARLPREGPVPQAGERARPAGSPGRAGRHAPLERGRRARVVGRLQRAARSAAHRREPLLGHARRLDARARGLSPLPGRV